jgi:hypothetical protein
MPPIVLAAAVVLSDPPTDGTVGKVFMVDPRTNLAEARWSPPPLSRVIFNMKEKGNIYVDSSPAARSSKKKAMYIKSFRAYQHAICDLHHSNSLQMEGTTIFPHT